MGSSGIHKDSNAGTTTATNNWWGCNAGAASAPCDRAVKDLSLGTLIVTPHLVLNHAASPSTIVVGQTSALTADFLTNSASAAIAVANLDAIIGTTHAHNNAVRGTLSATQTAIQAAGSATATFTATAAGAGSADSVVDSQTKTVAITINKATTTTTITSDTPDPSVGGGVVAVNYSVAVSAPGSGTPTGNVVVTISGGAETCTGTVAAGACNITLTTIGSRTLTATYAGDTNFTGSSDTEAHTVVSPTNVSIAVAPASVNEDGATNLIYTVTRDTNLVTATTVNITTSGSATSGTDYSGGVATATIPANGTTATITIDPSLDSTVESDETVILTVATGAGYTVGTPASATGTILNDDLPSASIAVAPASVAEDGVPNLVYTVTLDQPALTPTSINFTTAGTATSSTDYAAVTSPLVIPTGNTTGTITVNPTADTTIEADETVILMLAAGAGYTIGTPANATGTILNDDLPNLTINDVSLNEGSAGTSNATFTVSLSAPAGPGGVSFDIATANGTATAGSDYAAKSLSGQTISAGSSTYTFTVLVNGDTLNEPNETFFVNVSNVMGAIVVDGQALGTITNDDSVPALSIDNVSVLEGNAGTANAVFAVTLSAASGQTVSVNYATADGTAQQPGDYTAKNGTLTFTPGQTTATVTVLVNGDIVLEGDETFTVGLSGATNATISTATGTGTIIDDELPTLAINDVSITEGNVGTSVMTFTVTRTGTTASASGFSFATADGTALTSDSDYVTANGTGSIAGGGASGTTTVSVTINGDAIFENNESFVVNLTAPTNAVISDAQGVGTITNDDTAPTLSINDVSITEGNTGTQNLSFTVTRTGLTALPASFTATSANGTATAPSDYLAALAGVSSIAGGGATGTTTLTATVNGDFIAEANETFSVNLSAPINATISDAQGIGTINNDDTLGIVVTQSGGSTDVTEGGATDSYTLVLTSQPTSNVSISVTPDTQVTVATSPVVFTTTNWNVAQTVTVTAVDDVAVEGQHTGTISHAVTSADAAYNGFAVANVVANITDNDLPTLAINDVSIVEGNAGTSTLSFTVIRTGTTPSTVGFSYATSDGTALTSDNDYVAAIGTGMIPSGGATGTTTVSVTINGDAFFENNETFNVNLSAPTNAAISDGTGVGTITNDDTAPVITISDQTVTEGNTGTVPMVFTITRTGLSKLPATVVYASADDSATAPSDYTAVNGTAIIAADTQNVATTTVTVLVNGDTTIEGNETLFLNLSTPGNATIGDNQGLGTITNDDGPPSFTPAGAITRQQGSSATLATLGTVSDLTDPAGSLTVAIVADSTVGVSTTALTNTNGTVTANIAASCTATAGSLTVQVTDLGGLTGTDIVPINVSANTPPTLSYSNVIVGVGTTSSQNPSTGLSDNGSVSSIAVQSAGSYTGGISVSNAGVISLNNATPAGTHTITVRATDNCGASTDATVQVTVNQATTFKEVTSNVSPSRFGQALTLSAQLSGVDPTGSVEFFAGALSLGSAPLVNSPSGGTSLKLASLSISTLPVGNSNITVVYAGDVNNAASSSAILLQTVQAADTSIVLSPAVNPAVVGSSTINIQVQALAPGGGIPAGMVMLSAGPGNNCVATLTAGNGSCVLNFASAGFAAITASYTPANGNHLASIGGTALVVVGNPSSTDLRVRIGNGVRNIGAGQTVRYDIVVDNIGTEAAVGRLQVPLSSDYSSATFSCLSAGPADCGNPSTGTGSIDREVSLAPGGVVIYSLDVTAPLNPERTITQSASITTKAPTTDTDLSNNEAFDIDPMGLLSDGFEDQAIAE